MYKYIFVYGTLMMGQPNHYLLGTKEGESEFFQGARLEGFDMYNLGAYPGIVPGDGTVWGELYRTVEPPYDVATRLARLEGVRYDKDGNSCGLYHERIGDVYIMDTSVKYRAVFYEFNNRAIGRRMNIIETGRWV